MGKIIILTGKSSCGKTTVLKKLSKRFIPIVTNTTRPMRDGEKDGVDYHFISDDEFNYLIESGDMLEYHTYNTAFGKWSYGTSIEDIDLHKHNYVVVLTLDGAKRFVEHFGYNNCIIFYLYCDNEIRECRAKDRGSFNSTEWNRRLKTDMEDFEPNKVAKVCNFSINTDKNIKDVLKEINKIYTMYTK